MTRALVRLGLAVLAFAAVLCASAPALTADYATEKPAAGYSPLVGEPAAAAERPVKRLNILFFTADDMILDSSGAYGGPIKDLTPHVDRLAAEGLRFQYAYSTVAVCQPARQIMQTGLYPHRSGAMGFFPIRPEVRTLNQQLHDAGYLISMFGKGNHHEPKARFCVDVADDTISRHPSHLAAATGKCRRGASEQGRPDLDGHARDEPRGQPRIQGQLLQPAWDRRAVDQRRQIRRALDPDDVAGETGQDQQQDRVPRSIGDV